MQAVKAGGLYFALVFGAGFVFGTSWGVVARPGCRDAEGELLELCSCFRCAPIMWAADKTRSAAVLISRAFYAIDESI